MLSSCFHVARTSCKALLNAWLKLQVSHRGGKYSIERMFALEEYTRTVSLFRVISVCLGTPALMIILVVGQELLPLGEPSAGWRASYGFWIRLALVGAVIAHTAVVQAQYLIDKVELSHWQQILIAGSVGVTFSLLAMVFGSEVVFPIPFVIISGVPVFYALLLLFFRIFAGWQFFQAMTADWGQTLQYTNYSGSQVLMVVTYPCYQLLFTLAVNTRYELPAILLLPFIKMFMKYLLSTNTAHMEDLMPEEVIFTADFFNSMYLATCMQKASSVLTITIMVALDLVQTTVGLFSLRRRTTSILERVEHVVGGGSQPSLLSSVASLCRNAQLFKKQQRGEVTLRSSLEYRLDSTTKAWLETLAKIPMNQRLRSTSNDLVFVKTPFSLLARAVSVDERKRFHFKLFTAAQRVRRTSVCPVMPTTTTIESAQRGEPTESLVLSSRHLPRHTGILQETLETLFTSECMVLTEYLETLIPVLYGGFVLIMVRLPSARYHIELEGITTENVYSTVQSVFVLAFLELVSFVVLIAVMQRNCGMNALYQLAFVLETQMILIQDKLATWALVTMAFRVVHFGVDFTFHFAWV